MELFIIMATVAFICRDPSGTIRAATSYKRAQIDQQLAKNPRGRHPGHRAFRNYLGTVWQTQWEEASRRYPQQMQAAKQRRAWRRARRLRTWDQVQQRAGARWDQRHSTPAKERPGERDFRGRLRQPRDEDLQATNTLQRLAEKYRSGRSGAPVVDLDAARRRREQQAKEPAKEEQKAKEPADTTGAGQTGRGQTPMSVNLSDATSLRAHLAALREHATYQDKTCTAKEQLAAGMTDAQVGEATIASVDASRAASAHAAAMARAAADALEEANMGVAEARASSPDAGSGDYYEPR